VIYLYLVFLAAVAVAAALGVLEQRRHVARLRAFGTRVIVLGDEKAEIVQACAQALDEGRWRVAAQTGWGSTLLLPGEPPRPSAPVPAPFPQRKRFVRTASDRDASALVVDALSRSPSLVREDREQLIAADVTIVQPEDGAVPRTDELEAAVPADGLCLTTDPRIMEALEPVCANRGCRCLLVEAEAHGRPVALALALAAERGVDRDAALAAATSGRWTWSR
jgi:hypothetical protein